MPSAHESTRETGVTALSFGRVERWGNPGRTAPAAADTAGCRGRDRRRGGGAAARATLPRADRRRGDAADRPLAAVLLRLLPGPAPSRPEGGRAAGRRSA